MTEARIHDTGYRKFEGERRPVWWAILDLAKHGVQRVLGLKRKGKHKLLPFAIIVAAFLPAIVIVGLAVMNPFDDLSDRGPQFNDVSDVGPQLGEYFGFISLLVVLFVSFVSPEALCTDRRTGMLGLYLASPLTRDTYLLGRFAGLFAVIAFIASGPQLLILAATGFEGSGPDNVLGYLSEFARIVAAGFLVALLLTTVGMAISSLTARNGIASALIVITLMTLAAVTGALIEGGGVADEFAVFNVVGLAESVGRRIFGEPPHSDVGTEVLATPLVIFAALAWSTAAITFCRFRYQRIDVRQ